MLIDVWNKIYPIIISVLFFELIIIIHEGGHYVAARLMKIKVNEFAVGMGPKIFSFKRGDTEYSLRWILFGGYCRMEGENEDSDCENSFCNKRVIQRIFVVVAGAVMNLILGFIIVAIIISSQDLIGTPTVAKFGENAVSSSVLQEGDTIRSIDGMLVYTATDVSSGLSRSPDDTVDMTIVRDGKSMDVTVRFATEIYEGKQFISMDFWLLGVPATFGNVLRATCMEWVSYARIVFLSVHDLIVGRYGVSDLSGPVGAVSVMSTAAKSGSTAMLRIMALLTINVGLFNLFPIPALDGWRLSLLVFEGLFKRKFPQKWEWAINVCGLVLLIGLMCLVTFSDLTKLF